MQNRNVNEPKSMEFGDTIIGLPGIFINSSGKFSLLRSHDKGRYICRECNMRFPNENGLKIHKNIHAGERQYQCDQCSEAFTYQYDLEIHIGTHTRERPYQCSQCDKTFICKSDLTTHVGTHNGERMHNNKTPYTCKECNIIFWTESDYTIHNKKHLQEMSDQCSQCDKTGICNGDLITHVGTHNDERVHTNKAPYPCKECKIIFWIESDFINHNKNYHKEMPYQCSQCDETFKRKDDLKKHTRSCNRERMHNNKTPYTCKECNIIFWTESDYIIHNKKHLEEMPYQCSQCDKTPIHKGDLTEHTGSCTVGETQIFLYKNDHPSHTKVNEKLDNKRAPERVPPQSKYVYQNLKGEEVHIVGISDSHKRINMSKAFNSSDSNIEVEDEARCGKSTDFPSLSKSMVKENTEVKVDCRKSVRVKKRNRKYSIE